MLLVVIASLFLVEVVSDDRACYPNPCETGFKCIPICEGHFKRLCSKYYCTMETGTNIRPEIRPPRTRPPRTRPPRTRPPRVFTTETPKPNSKPGTCLLSDCDKECPKNRNRASLLDECQYDSDCIDTLKCCVDKCSCDNQCMPTQEEIDEEERKEGYCPLQRCSRLCSDTVLKRLQKQNKCQNDGYCDGDEKCCLDSCSCTKSCVEPDN